MKQQYSSRNTSINKVTKVYKQYHFTNSLILDYGGGRYDSNKDYVSQFNNTLYVYDPYNRTAEENKLTLEAILVNGGADIVVCANVLNVIQEDEILEFILHDLMKFIKVNGVIYIQVYQGDSSGIGKPTIKGYQRNQKTKDYWPLISKIYSDKKITCKGNIYEIR